MKHQYKFDAEKGIMVPSGDIVNAEIELSKGQKSMIKTDKNYNALQSMTSDTNRFIRLHRVGDVTPLQLVDDNGMPESYLDSDSKGVLMFRELEDYDVCQISDEKTGKVLAYIGGYALAFNFNMAELNSMERIEQCLQGIVKLFRHKIMTQNISVGTGNNKI